MTIPNRTFSANASRRVERQYAVDDRGDNPSDFAGTAARRTRLPSDISGRIRQARTCPIQGGLAVGAPTWFGAPITSTGSVPSVSASASAPWSAAWIAVIVAAA